MNLLFVELFLYSGTVRLYGFCKILIKVSLIVWNVHNLTYLNFELNIPPGILKGQIEKKFLEWGSNPRNYFRAEIQKYFRSFLVQVKTAKNPFEIYWPLPLGDISKLFKHSMIRRIWKKTNPNLGTIPTLFLDLFWERQWMH